MLTIGIDASRAFVEERTGTENYSYRILEAMLRLDEARGYRWVIFVKSKVKSQKSKLQLKTQNLDLEIVGINWPRLWTQWGLALETWKWKLDVLWIPAHTLPVLARPGIKKVVTIHGLEYEWLPEYQNNLQRWYLPLSTKYAARVADRIIAVSKFTKQQLVERLQTDANKIKVVYEGVDEEFFGRKRKKSEIEKVKRKYRVGEKYLLFVGSLQPRKNLPFLVEVFAKLKQKYPDLQLVLAGGKGWMYEEIFEAPKRFGVEEEVVFPGRVSDEELACLLQGAEVYVQPSITEGFGLPVLEAMAAGCPVVSSNGGALPEVVGEASSLLPLASSLIWVRGISRILDDNQLKRRVVEGGRKRVKEFSWEEAARKTLRVLASSL